MPDAEKPWFDEYETFGVPKTLEPYPDEPVHQILVEASEEYPDAGLVQHGRTVTYEELWGDVERLATALRERGVTKGTRVATILPTSVQFVLSDYAISRAGGVHIPNDFLAAEDDLRDRLDRGDPEVLIADDANRELAVNLFEDIDASTLVLTEVEDYSDDPPEHEELDGAEWLPHVVSEASRDPPDVEFDVESDVHTLLFTGGTTGRPKGCLLTHRNVYANALQGVACMSQMAKMLRGSESALMGLPIYHAYGYSVMNSLMELPVNVLMAPDPQDSEYMAELINEETPILMMGVPTQYMDIVDQELENEVIGVSGSAPLADETKEEFSSNAKGVSQGYGLSEMSPITHFDTRGVYEMMVGEKTEHGLDQPTIGIPVPDTEVKLRDIDSDETVSLDSAIDEELECEMYLKGPQRMLDYLDAEQSPFDEDGYVPTGDVVRVDDEGYFYVVDRVKNMINVSGLKVYSEEVDELLYGHEHIQRPATVGVPDPDRPGSEQVKVYVEPEPDAPEDFDADDVRDFLEGDVPRQAVPDIVEFVEEIPLTAVGKVDKKQLRERHEESPAEAD